MSAGHSFTSVVCVLAVVLTGCRGFATGAEDVLTENGGSGGYRQPRHLKSKLCLLGLCGGQGYGGYQGGHQGGYGGYQGGYPPINIGISQSQSSASAGGGGFGSGYFPNNYQYNGHPGGYNRPGYFGNGFGSYNNQFNGNYYGGRPQGGGYGFQGPYGNFYDEKPVYENEEDYFRSAKAKD